MSLIDEALKRAQAAHEVGGEREERPWTPPPLPDPRRHKRMRMGPSIGLSATAALLLAAFFLWRSHRAAKPSLRSAPTPATAVGLPPIDSEVAVVPPPQGLPASRVAPGAPSARSATAGRRALSTSPIAFSSSPAPSSAAGADARETRSQGPGAEPKSFAAEMTLPGGRKITLDGIVFSEASPAAVVNGRVLPVGGFIEGYTIARILPDRVELEREGRSVVLTLR